MRLFLAINLEAGVRQAILEGTSVLRDAAPTLPWLEPGRLHLTLKFIGVRGDEAVGPLTELLDEVAERHRRFPIRLRQVGAFPNFRRARVVWLGVEQEPRLELLQHDVEVAGEARGFAMEGRPFRPHITLTRVKGELAEGTRRQLARAGKRVSFEEDVTVESIDLMNSEPGPDGSRYTRLHAAALRVT